MKYLLMDMMYMAHRARIAVNYLPEEEWGVGMLLNFLDQIRTLATQFKSNKILIFGESKHSYRKNFFEYYKLKQGECKTPELIDQIRIMKEQVVILQKSILPAMGIIVNRQKGLEADDLIAWTARKLTGMGIEGIIITGDGDLYQCITKKVIWHDPRRSKTMDLKNLMIQKNVTPEEWGMVKALAGCVSDNVPGIYRISEKGAIQWLKGEINSKSKKYERIQKAINSGQVERWKKLVILPHEKTKDFPIRVPKYNPKEFFKICKKHNLYLEGKEKLKWERFFQGNFHNVNIRRRNGKEQRKGLSL